MKLHKVNDLPEVPVLGDVYLVKKSTGVAIAAVQSDAAVVLEVQRKVNLNGPTSLFHTEVGTYTIQDYSDENEYVVSSTDGTVSRNGSVISFSASNPLLTSASFTVNQRVFTVTMKAIAVSAPTILAPTDGSTNVAPSGSTVYATPFTLNYAGATDTIVSADWELATDPDFTNIVASSYGDTVNKTSWPLP